MTLAREYKLIPGMVDGLPDSYNNSIENINKNKEMALAAIEANKKYYSADIYNTMVEVLNKAVEELEASNKYPYISNLLHFLASNSGDINAYYDVLKQQLQNVGVITNFDNTPLIFPAENTHNCYVFPNIIRTSKKYSSVYDINEGNGDVLKYFIKNLKEDLSHEQKKKRWDTVERACTTMFRKDEMSVEKAITRFVLPEAELNNEKLKKFGQAVLASRTPPKLHWALEPEDFIIMYSENGPSSCMTTHNSENKYRELAKANLHTTSFYGMLKNNEGKRLAAGVYVTINNRVIARAIVWKFPWADTWVCYRVYCDGSVKDAFLSLMRKDNIVFDPNFSVDTKNFSFEFDLLYSPKDAGDGVVPFPYFDGAPSRLLRYAKWDKDNNKLLGFISNKQEPKGTNWVNLSKFSTYTISLKAIKQDPCPICGKYIHPDHDTIMLYKQDDIYHRICIMSNTQFIVMVSHTGELVGIHKDEIKNHPELYKVSFVRDLNGTWVNIPENDLYYTSKNAASQYAGIFIDKDEFLELDNDLKKALNDTPFRTGNDGYNINMRAHNFVTTVRVTDNLYHYMCTQLKDYIKGGNFYYDAYIAGLKPRIAITSRLQTSVSIDPIGVFYEPELETVNA